MSSMSYQTKNGPSWGPSLDHFMKKATVSPIPAIELRTKRFDAVTASRRPTMSQAWYHCSRCMWHLPSMYALTSSTLQLQESSWNHVGLTIRHEVEMTDSTSKNVWPTSPHTKHDIPNIIHHISTYFSDSSLRSNLSRLSLHLLALNRCTARDLHKKTLIREVCTPMMDVLMIFCTWCLGFWQKID